MLQSRLHKCTKSASLTFCKNREITPSLYAEDDATRLICSPDVFKLGICSEAYLTEKKHVVRPARQSRAGQRQRPESVGPKEGDGR